MDWVVAKMKWIMLLSGALIALVGAMLIYGAYHPPVRPLVLTVAGASKLIFIGLVMTHGKFGAGQKSGISIAVDLVMVLLFVVYLVRARRHAVV